MEDRSDHQSAQDRILGIKFRATWPIRGLPGIPFLNDLRTKPKSDATPIFQRLVILFPVADKVLVFFLEGCVSFLVAILSLWFLVCVNQKFYRLAGLKAKNPLSIAIYATKPLPISFFSYSCLAASPSPCLAAAA